MTRIRPMATGSLLERCARMQMGDNEAALPPISVRRVRRTRHRFLNVLLALFTTALILWLIGLWWVS
jgi:hypothetical protein